MNSPLKSLFSVGLTLFQQDLLLKLSLEHLIWYEFTKSTSYTLVPDISGRKKLEIQILSIFSTKFI